MRILALASTYLPPQPTRGTKRGHTYLPPSGAGFRERPPSGRAQRYLPAPRPYLPTLAQVFPIAAVTYVPGQRDATLSIVLFESWLSSGAKHAGRLAVVAQEGGEALHQDTLAAVDGLPQGAEQRAEPELRERRPRHSGAFKPDLPSSFSISHAQKTTNGKPGVSNWTQRERVHVRESDDSQGR